MMKIVVFDDFYPSFGVWKVKAQQPIFDFDPFVIVPAPTKVINGKVFCPSITKS
jgi:hypothetical protein